MKLTLDQISYEDLDHLKNAVFHLAQLSVIDDRDHDAILLALMFIMNKKLDKDNRNYLNRQHMIIEDIYEP